MSINKSPHDVVGVSREAKIVSSAGERGRKRQGGLFTTHYLLITDIKDEKG